MYNIHRFGKANSNYKNGITCEKHFCKNCKKELKSYYAIRCHSCDLKNRFQNPKNHPMYGKSVNWRKIKYKGIWMRSTWEVAYARYLDYHNIKWLYEFKIFDLGNTTYTPDFYLPEIDTYVEIKGWVRKDFIKKIKRFKKLYKNIKFTILYKNNKQLIKILQEFKNG